MFKHIIAYEGIHMSLAIMQEEYMEIFIEWPNRRLSVEGTLQRPPYTLSSGIEWIRSLDKRKGTDEVFAVLVHENAGTERTYRYVGHVGVHRIEWPKGVGTTGSIIGDVSAQGRGIGTEAKLWIQHHAFDVLHLRKLYSDVKAFNAQSFGHLLKCGYRYIGRREEDEPHLGGYTDTLLLECLRKKWQSIWEAYRATGELPKLTDAQRALIKKECEPS